MIAQYKGAGVVINAVAMVKIGHIKDRVLKDTRAIAHAQDVIQTERG